MEEGRITSRELVEAHLVRIATYEERVNAVMHVNAAALAEADFAHGEVEVIVNYYQVFQADIILIYQLAYGLEFNQNQLPDDVVYPKTPLDIDYSRTRDKGQRYESVVITQQGGNGKPQEGWNPLAKDKPEQGAPQLRQTPDGSRMYGIWLEEGEQGSDIMFRRVDYR